MMIDGAVVDYPRLTVYLARQVFIRLRSLSRDARSEPAAPQLDLFPGVRAASDVAREIATASFYVWFVRYAEPAPTRWNSPELAQSMLTVAWEHAGSFGRQWIDSLVDDTHGAQSDSTFASRQAARKSLAILNTLSGRWKESAHALASGDLSWFRAPASTVALCDYIAINGLGEIYRLSDIVRDESEDAARSANDVWRRIEVVSDTCHRLPVTWDPPAWLANVVLRSPLRDTWMLASDPGRVWLREALALAGPRFEERFSHLARRADRKIGRM